MRYHCLACDYDGTLALEGLVSANTVASLRRARASGRRLLLVTGRELEELGTIFPHLNEFDLVVAENGAVLYRPRDGRTRLLAGAPSPRFVEELRQRGVGPISVGHAIVATWQPHEQTVLEVIRDLGLELQVIFNKGAVMVLPASVNKATGLRAALLELGLSVHNVVGVGDAENDHAFLDCCECSVAVANAIPTLRQKVDLVTTTDHGEGVQELITRLLDDDLSDIDRVRERHCLDLGTADDGHPVWFDPYGDPLLILGPTGSGKSTWGMGLLGQLAIAGYQFLVIDTEGDYGPLQGVTRLGSLQQPPAIEDVARLLTDPLQNVVVNLARVPVHDRSRFFADLCPQLGNLREQTGRPHWILLDEARQALAAENCGDSKILFQQSVLVSVAPEALPAEALTAASRAVAVGSAARNSLKEYCRRSRVSYPASADGDLVAGESFLYDVATAQLRRLREIPGGIDHGTATPQPQSEISPSFHP